MTDYPGEGERERKEGREEKERKNVRNEKEKKKKIERNKRKVNQNCKNLVMKTRRKFKSSMTGFFLTFVPLFSHK